MPQTLTLVVHGTYADGAQWWRLGESGEPTFADHLEEQLRRHGLPGSVWRPALSSEFDYTAFAWSGLNRHRDRVQAGKKLGASLNQLADRIAATADAPLTVNFVAHSHGGNVVLEALRHLKPNVRTGRVAFLGTPLIRMQPIFRPGRFFLSTIWFWFFFLGLMMVLVALVKLGAQAFGSTILADFKPAALVLTALGLMLGYVWLFFLFGNLMDVGWRVLCRLAQPLRWLQDKSWSWVYGPSDATLAARLHGCPILSIGTANDEADLLLRVGAAPASLYLEYVRAYCPRWARPFEWLLLRPFAQGIVLSGAEMLLEIVALGFSPWRALLIDFDIASAGGRRHRSTPLFVDEREDVAPRPARPQGPVAAAPAPDVPYRLASSLAEVVGQIKRQVQLRHTAYYDNEAVVERVARHLTSSEPATATRPEPAPSRWQTAGFWEALLAANVAIAVLLSGIKWGFKSAVDVFVFVGGVGVLAYLVPFAGLGAIGVASRVVNHRWPRKKALWFWLCWAAFAMVVTLGILMERFLPAR